MPAADLTFGLPADRDHPWERLADIISKSVSILTQATPISPVSETTGSHSVNGLDSHTKGGKDSASARGMILDACRTLIQEVSGPTEILKNMALIDKHNLASLQIINHFRIANIVPLEGTIEINKVADDCGLPAGILARILRQAMTYGVFAEPKRGFVAHTSMSLEIPRLSPLLTYQLEVCLPSTLALTSWLEQNASEAKAPFQIAHTTDDSWWAYAEKRPDLTRNYGLYMALITNGGPHDVNHVVSGFDWGKLGRALLIDIGGADGFVGITIAEAFPLLSVIVQDSSNLKQSADAKIPLEMRGRVAFIPHSFFHPQEAIGKCADVFLLRHILHDWPDEDCVTILRHLTACMKPGARIVVAEQVLGQPGSVDRGTDRVMRALDMQMMVQFGGKERTLEDWENLFTMANPKLCLIRSVQPSGSADTLLELERRD